jgi:CheY-like chemotaxis protein
MFSIELRKQQPNAVMQPLVQQLPEVRISNPPPRLLFRRALVVDDSALNRKMVANVLKDYFSEVVQAGDGLEALDAMRRAMESNQVFDIVFMDSIMPNMGGIEACRVMRSLGFTNMIIAVTGNILPEDVREYADAGANDVLIKPLKIEKLEETLESK